MDDGSITTIMSVVRTQSRGITVQPTKRKLSRRKIDIDPDTVEVLSSHRSSNWNTDSALGCRTKTMASCSRTILANHSTYGLNEGLPVTC